MKKLKNTELIFSIVFIVIVVLLAIVFFIVKDKVTKPNTSTYQMVQLIGGQQFFGKLHAINTDHPSMTDVYYVQSKGANQEDPTKQNFVLVKMGNEIHGPEDILNFNPEQIVYWTNLKPESQVMQGIQRDAMQKNSSLMPPASSVPSFPNQLPASN